MNPAASLSAMLNVNADFEYNGKVYKLQEANLEQRTAFAAWVKDQAWKEIERLEACGVSPKLLEMQVKSYNHSVAAQDFEWGGAPVLAAANSLEGQKYLTFLVLRENHQEITELDVEEMFKAKRKELEQRINEVSADPKGLSAMVASLLGAN